MVFMAEHLKIDDFLAIKDENIVKKSIVLIALFAPELDNVWQLSI